MTTAYKTAGRLEENESVQLNENFQAPLWAGIQRQQKKKPQDCEVTAERREAPGVSPLLPAKVKPLWGRADGKRARTHFMMWPTFTGSKERQRLGRWSSGVKGGAAAGNCSCKLRLVIHHCLHCSIRSSIIVPFMPCHSFQKDDNQKWGSWSRRSPGCELLQVDPSASRRLSLIYLCYLLIYLLIFFLPIFLFRFSDPVFPRVKP